MSNDLVLRVISRLLIPFILLFALYVQFHGDSGPGGGFQAGVIIAAGLIFFALTHGVATARKIVPDWLVETFRGGFIAKNYGENQLSNLLYLTRYRKSINASLQIVFKKPSKDIYNEWKNYYSPRNPLTKDNKKNPSSH